MKIINQIAKTLVTINLRSKTRRRTLGLAVIGISVPLALYAGDTLYTFSEGTIISSTQMNENFDNIDDRLVTYEDAISVEDAASNVISALKNGYVGVGTSSPAAKLQVVGGWIKTANSTATVRGYPESISGVRPPAAIVFHHEGHGVSGSETKLKFLN